MQGLVNRFLKFFYNFSTLFLWKVPNLHFARLCKRSVRASPPSSDRKTAQDPPYIFMEVFERGYGGELFPFLLFYFYESTKFTALSAFGLCDLCLPSPPRATKRPKTPHIYLWKFLKGGSRTGVKPNCPSVMHFRIFRQSSPCKICILLRFALTKSIKNAFADGCKQF